jgi:hypothetical protein
MSIVIIGYNQYTYISKMVKQLEKLTNDIIIIDNMSNYTPLLNYYSTEYKYTLLKMDKNYGHKVYENNFITELLGNVFIITDPDLKFNDNLPSNCIEQIISVSNMYQARQVGFALLIDTDDIRPGLSYGGMTLKEWEGRFWKQKLNHPTLELYSAAIDTTFNLINFKYGTNCLSIRIGGNYICKHLPWHNNFYLELLNDEYDQYLLNNKSTNFWIDKNKNNKQVIKPEEKCKINFNDLIDNKLEKNEYIAINIGSCIFTGNNFKYVMNINNNEILDGNNILNYSNIISFKQFIFDNILLKNIELNKIILIVYTGDDKYIIDDLTYYSNMYNINLYINNILIKSTDLKFKKYMTSLIIGYDYDENHINNMIKQLEKYTKDIIIIDNKDIKSNYTLFKTDKNNKSYEKIIGNIYIITEPNIVFNVKLPNNFIEQFIKISEYYQAEKVGFAIFNDKLIYKFYLPNIENAIWLSEIKNTFCLINKNNTGNHYKISGNFLAKKIN